MKLLQQRFWALDEAESLYLHIMEGRRLKIRDRV